MQTKFVSAPQFEVFGGGAKGPGKSDCLIAMPLRQVHRERFSAYLCRETGPQMDDLKRRTHRLYPKLAQKPSWQGDGHGRWKFPSGAQIVFESIATQEDVMKIQGKEPSWVGQDEVANLPDERVIDLVQAEIRSPDPEIRCGWRGTGNPGKAGHPWVKRRFVIPCGERGQRIIVRRVTLPNGAVGELTRRYVPGTVLDNPIYANDVMYMAQLATMPKVLRDQLLYGDWNAGYGTALGELNEQVHMIRPFRVPDHWPRWGSFDYGFAHNWVWVDFTSSEDGMIYVTDTVRGRRHLPHQIAERVKSKVDIYHPARQYNDTDSYALRSRKELREDTPTIAEVLAEEHDIILRHGNTDRKAGLTNARYYLAWQDLGEGGGPGQPGVQFFDTPGNRWLFEQLGEMVVDEDDMEDVLKVNSNPETGEGGDDGYDAWRVGMASRPPRAIGAWWDGTPTAFSKETLAFMVEQLYRDTPGLTPEAGRNVNMSNLYTGV
jgi:hypothetical protein